MSGSNIVHGRIWFLGCALPIGPEMGSTGSMGNFCCIKRGHLLSLSFCFLFFPAPVNEQWLLEMMVRAGRQPSASSVTFSLRKKKYEMKFKIHHAKML